MIEPVSLIIGAAAAGGAAGKLAELFTGYVKDLVKGQDRKAQESAAENTARFLANLSAQIDGLEKRLSADQAGPAVEAAMADPDVATTTKLAVLAAARTSSAEKHDVLARAVAERLVADAESIEAVVSSAAVDVVPKLSAVNLGFLGLAAVVYGIRPDTTLPLRTARQSASGSNGWAPHTQYVEWLRENLRVNALDATLAELNIVHLAAESCVLYERKMKKELHRTLYPHNSELYDPRTMTTIAQDIGALVHLDQVGRDLHNLWKAGLQHTTLTPIGLLIGTAVHQAKTGEPISVPWYLAEEAIGTEVDDAVWDGRRIDERFLRALDGEVKDRAERGVGIWRFLDRK